MNTTFERLQAILVKDYKVAPETLTVDARLDSLGLDSLGVVELLWNVEDEFKVSLPSEPVPLSTVGDVVLFIDALIQAQRGAGAQAGVAGIPGLGAT
jgi:acyl carrier protein